MARPRKTRVGIAFRGERCRLGSPGPSVTLPGTLSVGLATLRAAISEVVNDLQPTTRSYFLSSNRNNQFLVCSHCLHKDLDIQ
jgi:hypothetical protein